MTVSADRIASTILALLNARATGATICPSEVARALHPVRWRPLMPAVREAASLLALAGEVELRQRGQVIAPLAEVRGPLRIGRVRGDGEPAAHSSSSPSGSSSSNDGSPTSA